jgi:hypothetical protein
MFAGVELGVGDCIPLTRNDFTELVTATCYIVYMGRKKAILSYL